MYFPSFTRVHSDATPTKRGILDSISPPNLLSTASASCLCPVRNPACAADEPRLEAILPPRRAQDVASATMTVPTRARAGCRLSSGLQALQQITREDNSLTIVTCSDTGLSSTIIMLDAPNDRDWLREDIGFAQTMKLFTPQALATPLDQMNADSFTTLNADQILAGPQAAANVPNAMDVTIAETAHVQSLHPTPRGALQRRQITKYCVLSLCYLPGIGTPWEPQQAWPSQAAADRRGFLLHTRGQYGLDLKPGTYCVAKRN